MEIKVGEFLVNQTRRFILPIVQDYGDELVKELNSIFKLAVGIGDAVLPQFNNHLFILIDVTKNFTNFVSLLNFVRTKDYYETDYPYDDVKDGTQHMLVLKLPDNHRDNIANFIKGEYSKMFPGETVKKYFKVTDIRYKIIKKDNVLLKSYVDDINKTFETEFEYDEWTDEIEKSPLLEEEIFNYKFDL